MKKNHPRESQHQGPQEANPLFAQQSAQPGDQTPVQAPNQPPASASAANLHLTAEALPANNQAKHEAAHSSAPSQSSQNLSRKKKRRPLKWYDYVILLIIILLFITGIYQWISPKLVRKQQLATAQELFDLVPVEHRADEQTLPTLYVDPDKNKVAGEAWESFAQGEENYQPGEKVLLRPIGRLRIPSIDLSLPILDKAGLVELRYGIGLYQNSAPLYSANGISVLFGHHMYERGHFFNQLEEVKVGDKVQVSGNQKDYIYTVDRTIVLTPEEMIPLLTEANPDKYLLLITCVNEPAFDQRLLVYAKLTETKEMPAKP